MPPPSTEPAAVTGTVTGSVSAEEVATERPEATAGPHTATAKDKPRLGGRAVLRGFSWATTGQLVTAGGNLALTPFVIHGLGIERYGLFALTGTINNFMGNLTGGLSGTAARYFPIYAGADDRVATTKLLMTFLAIVLVVGLAVGVADWYVSPVIVDALSMRRNLRPESLFLFRTLCLLVVAGSAHSLVQSVATARQRFDRAVQAQLLCYLLWVVGLIWVVHHHEGLRGVAVIFVAQQVAASLVLVPTASRYLSRQGMSFLPWKQVRELLGFSARLQVFGSAALVNNEIDTLVIGGAISVRDVGIYNVGVSFAAQLISVVYNVLGPASVQMGNTLGRDGPERVYQQFKRMQRHWVRGVTGFCAVGAVASYFGVVAWVGRGFTMGSWIAITAILGAIPSLGVALLGIYVVTMRKPGLEMRYALCVMTVNLACTAALVTFGPIGIVLATNVANFVAAAFFVRLARRGIRRDLANFFREIPLVRPAVCAGITLVLELAIRPHLAAPGPAALLECVPPAVVGLVFYAILMVGLRDVSKLLFSLVRTRRLGLS